MLLALTAGCTTASYPGPRLAKDQVALIRRCGYSARPPLHTSACIQDVDGAPVDGNHVEILPGRHDLGVRIITNRSLYPTACQFPGCGELNIFSASISIAFHAEAGHEYGIYAREAELKEWQVGIVDERSQAVVGEKKIVRSP
jgi:hypothetical protein